MTPPNVLLLAVDSLRADVVFGDHVSTPNFDAYAARGCSFTQCVSTTTSTTPSFSSILTGCYPPRHGVRGLQGYRLNPAVTTMAEAFAAAGYETHAEVTGPLVSETGVLRGFADARHRPGYRVPFFAWRDDVVQRMEAYAAPWFMLLHIWEVHRPYRPPPDFKKQWDRAGYEAVVAAADEWLEPVFDAVGDDTIVIITGDHGEDYPDSRWQQKLIRVAQRTRRAARLDSWLPQLDGKLAQLAVGHGFALFEHLVRVPLVIAGPGISTIQVGQQVRHVDLFPTVAELCGVEAPEGIDGRSLVPSMRGEELAEEPAYMEAVGVKLEGNRIEAVRTSDWKLLRRGTGRPMLYNLNAGGRPDEKRNVYRDHPDVARRLESALQTVVASASGSVSDSGMTDEEEAVVEQHLRDLGYL